MSASNKSLITDGENANTEKLNNKKHEFFIESYIDDPVLLKEYREMFMPFKQRGQYALMYTTLCCLGAFQYIKNLNYYMNKFFKNRKRPAKT